MTKEHFGPIIMVILVPSNHLEKVKLVRCILFKKTVNIEKDSENFLKQKICFMILNIRHQALKKVLL